MSMMIGRRWVAIAGIAGGVCGLGACYYHFDRQSAPKSLHPDNARFTPLPLIDRRAVSPTAFRMRVAVPPSDQRQSRDQPPSAVDDLLRFRRKCAFYFLIKDPRVQVARAYSPVHFDPDEGAMDFVVRRYAWPDGEVPRYLSALRPGEDAVEMHGPHISLDLSNVDYWAKDHPNDGRRLGLIVAGTGIAPAYQLMRAIAADPEDNTKISLIYANRSPDEVLLRDELLQLQRDHPKNRIQITWTVDSVEGQPSTSTAPEQEWTHVRGYVNARMIAGAPGMPGPEDPAGLVLVCGPPPFMRAVSGLKGVRGDWDQGQLGGVLRDLGYQAERVFKF